MFIYILYVNLNKCTFYAYFPIVYMYQLIYVCDTFIIYEIQIRNIYETP